MATVGDISQVRVLAVNDWIGYEIADRPSVIMLKDMITRDCIPFVPKKLSEAIAKDIEAFYAAKNTHVLGRIIAPQIVKPKTLFVFTFDYAETKLFNAQVETVYRLKSIIWVRKTSEEGTWRYRRYRTKHVANMAAESTLQAFGNNPMALVGRLQTTARHPEFIDMEGPNLIREGVISAK